MDLRRMWRVVWSMGLSGWMVMPWVFAADESVASHETSREEILQVIEATKQTDPELAEEMERQFELLESGEIDLDLAKEGPLSGPQDGGALAGGAPDGGARLLLGPPADGGITDEHGEEFMQVQSDPRMQDIRQQFESGRMTEQEAMEKTFDVLRDHGIEPDQGREWEGQGRDRELFERGGGFEERAWERMAPEAREQLERTFGKEHEGEHTERELSEMERDLPEMERDYPTMEREMPELERELPEMEHDMPEVERDTESAEREWETPTRDVSAPEHDMDHEMEMEFEREFEQPPQP